MSEIWFDYIVRQGEKLVHNFLTIEKIEQGMNDDEDYEIVARRRYTGLKDKGGGQIFEDDILLGDYNKVYDFARWKVEFRDGRFATDCIALHHAEDGFKDISRGGYSNPYLSQETCDHLEIIGNIYENPELLRQVS